MTDHSFEPRSGGHCGACGEYWEHPNHKAEHKKVIRYAAAVEAVCADPLSKAKRDELRAATADYPEAAA